MSRLADAARVFRIACQPYPVSLHPFYGPAAAQDRADVLTALRSGCRVPKSKAAWGVFRSELIADFGATGDTPAARERDLIARIEST